MLRRFLSGLCLFGTAFLDGQSTAAQTPRNEAPPKAMLVLDASGSMWGQIEGVAKITIAKQTLRDLVNRLDDTVALGLSVYGHRREGDCSDIETLVRPEEPDRAGLIAAIDGVKPKGKTPLSEAVRRAAQDLRYETAPASVILVSDGLENCGVDPCALAAELEASGVAFTAHVIGFGVTEDEGRALSCLSAETGGLYLGASDARSLASALERVVDTTREAARAAPPPAPPSTPAKEGAEFIALYAAGGLPVKQEISWEVFTAPESENVSARRLAFAFDADPVFDLDPGEYDLRIRAGLVERFFRVTVDEVDEKRAFAIDAGRVALFARRSGEDDALSSGVRWRLQAFDAEAPAGLKDVASTLDSRPGFIVNPGRYMATAQVGAAIAEVGFRIGAGDDISLEALLASGKVKLTPTLAAGGAPFAGFHSWAVVQEPPGGAPAIVASEAGNTAAFELPAGAYTVRLKTGGGVFEQVVEVKPDVEREVSFVMNAGYLRARASGGAPQWSLYRDPTPSDGDEVRIGSELGAAPSWILPAGNYLLEAIADGKKIRTSVSLAPGATEMLEFSF